MRAEIPRLEEYDVSPRTGFLPEELPLRRLPEYYDAWEDLAENLPALILTRRLRGLVDKIPQLSTSGLITERHWQRACTVLGFLSHGYVWGGDEPSDVLPQRLAEPWLEVCEHLELPPINTYAALCLWNFRTVVPAEAEDWGLDNLATLNTFTGCIDESWFYLVSTAIERQGAPCLATGLEAIHATRRNDSTKVVECLQALAEAIDGINTSLGRMYEMCDPHIFYYRIRPYLAGWKSMTDAGLPNGVRYGSEKEYRQYSGGSNAQSSLIQALDILLNVEHHPTGESIHRPPPTALLAAEHSSKEFDGISAPKKNNFIDEMRKYMPGPHRRFLEALSQVAEIRDYVMSHKDETPALVLSYDACLAMLRAFRDKHIQVVSRYIVLPSREGKPRQVITKRHGLAGSSKGSTGTGGTALIPFLKQARDETGDSAAGTWGRRLLTENRNLLMKLTASKRNLSFSSEEESEHPVKKSGAEEEGQSDASVGGLAGSWQIDNQNSSIAHW